MRVYTTGGILEYLLLDTLITVTGGDYQMKTTSPTTGGRDDQVDLLMSSYWCCGDVLKLLLDFTKLHTHSDCWVLDTESQGGR